MDKNLPPVSVGRLKSMDSADHPIPSNDGVYNPVHEWTPWGNRDCSYEQGAGGVLGKPGQPNQVIKSEHEHILIMRRPGPYRQTTPELRAASAITKEEHAKWFRDVWTDVPGARASDKHPAPYPVEIPYRLIRMFSFANDNVLDSFSGRFTTTVAAMKAGRNSVGVDVVGRYVGDGVERVTQEAYKLAA